ncbi:ROK family transcriptional regulator [Nonomuraea endophytica]|uniref:Putative NBD/HSP70 family sugar kinase n=1 Tax=Nonomuraea endophytica TaxID=714136 RepID=A0A7W8A3E7_9ACTN|nr:ROK family transcriptional regulator [Nonomuraea endophytica]MBB5078825.1 putative NBD/HSP70 family sugar kinase [Nonomuraea endophytica]
MTTPAIRRGANLPRVGDFNESVILDAIRRHPTGLSRVELARATGLSAQAVSNITRRLLDQGLVRESGKRSGGNGKPRTLLEIVPAARYAVGVHLDPAVITCVLVDLLGTVIAQRGRRTPRGGETDAIAADMASSVSALMAESGADRERILGLGIAAPGPIDVTAGWVVDPPELPGWGRYPLRERLSAATGLPALLDKDVTAAVVAERWTGAATDSRNLLFFYLGTGSGMGLVVDDTVLRGVSGNAGEVGGLGAACSSRAILEEAIALGVLGGEYTVTDPAEAQGGMRRLAELAAAGQAQADGIIERLAIRIGRGVCAAATLLDVDTIVFGGPIWQVLADRMLPVIEPMVAGSPFVKATHPTAVLSTTLGENVAAVGAASLVLDQALSAQPRSLLLG